MGDDDGTLSTAINALCLPDDIAKMTCSVVAHNMVIMSTDAIYHAMHHSRRKIFLLNVPQARA